MKLKEKHVSMDFRHVNPDEIYNNYKNIKPAKHMICF